MVGLNLQVYLCMCVCVCVCVCVCWVRVWKANRICPVDTEYINNVKSEWK